MNITLIHYAAPPVVGGVETVISRQAQLLVRAGHTVQIVTGRGDTWDAAIPVNVIPCIDSRFPQVLSAKASLDKGIVPDGFSDLVERIQGEIGRYIRGEDAVILHNVASLHKNLALTAALYNIHLSDPSIKYILWHHDLAWTASRYRSELHKGWPWDLLKTPWPSVKQVTVSKARRKELADLLKINQDVITVVSAGLDLQDFYGLNKRTVALLESMDTIFSYPIFLTPVRITRRKNLELAMEILAEIKKELPKATLIITGPPGAHNPHNTEYMQELINLRKKLKLEDKIHLLAEKMPQGLPDICVSDFYKIADALLLPSKEEGFGIPILEAGLASMPIFCTDLAPLKALAGKWATYFSYDEKPKDIARLIVDRLKKDPIFQLRIKVRQKYTWSAVYQRQIAPLLEDE